MPGVVPVAPKRPEVISSPAPRRSPCNARCIPKTIPSPKPIPGIAFKNLLIPTLDY